MTITPTIFQSFVAKVEESTLDQETKGNVHNLSQVVKIAAVATIALASISALSALITLSPLGLISSGWLAWESFKVYRIAEIVEDRTSAVNETHEVWNLAWDIGSALFNKKALPTWAQKVDEELNQTLILKFFSNIKL